MLKIEEIEQKLNEIEREMKNTVNALEENLGGEIDDLRGALAELKESKKEGKWKPELDKLYWYRGDEGINLFDTWENDEIDEWRRKNLKIFETEEECERYWHFMDTVKEKSYSFSADEWHTWGIKKYYIFYNYKNESLEVGDEYVTKDFGKTYFKEKSEAQYIIDNFKDELMAYFV